MNTASLEHDETRGDRIERATESSQGRTYVGYLALGTVVPAVIWLALVLVQMGRPTETSRWSYENYQRKTAYAESMATPKVVLVGGSATLFGTNAHDMSRSLGVPVVNFGTHAGLGLPYLLWKAKRVLRPGDVVVLSIEYELFSSGNGDALVDYVFARDPGYLRSLPIADQASLVYAVSYARLAEGLASIVRTLRPDPHPRYDSRNLDLNGDETHNSRADFLAQSIDKIHGPGWAELVPALTKYTVTSSNRVAMEKFAGWCNSKGITILATFPPLVNQKQYHTPQSQLAQAEYVRYYHHLGVPTLGTPSDSLYPMSAFYDTGYHLQADAELVHTKRLTHLLVPFMPRGFGLAQSAHRMQLR